MALTQFASRQVEILVVEDNEFDVNLTVAAFRDEVVPNRVHCVSDGEAAVAFLKHNGEYSQSPRPDLVVLDLNLPKMDGFEVLETIKSDPNLRSIPVVMVSGQGGQTEIRRAYELHAAAFVVKPDEVDDYFAAIRSLKDLWFRAATPVR